MRITHKEVQPLRVTVLARLQDNSLEPCQVDTLYTPLLSGIW